MITDFTLVRHGQTEANLQGIIQGHMDTELDELGRRQAECVAERLGNFSFDAVYSSDLRRAMSTAEAIAAHHGLPVIPCPALREWNLGEVEGRLCSEVQDVIKSFSFEDDDMAVPGGETRREFFQRVHDCLDELAERHGGGKILLVTHGGTMRAVFRHIIGRVSAEAMLPMTVNASYSRFFRRDKFWQLCCWNDISHLESIGFRDSVTF